jgi:hypothetical protein
VPLTPLSRSNVLPAAMFCVLCGLAATTARPGPDYHSYRDWADAVVRADLEELTSSQRSPRGHKLTQWLAGPALPYALPQAVAFDAIKFDTSMVVMGAIAALTVAGLLAGLFRRLSIDRPTAIFWLAAAWVASPIGYYALAFSSETLAIWMVALLVGVLFVPERRPHPLVVGLATAMLLMVRPYWVLYAIPTLVSVLRRDEKGGSRLRLALGILALALPIILAAAQLAIVNRWTTGDPWRFAYLFGDGEFRSVDLRHPEWGAVLWHPLHGLLVYHPAIGPALLAMIALIFRAPTAGERAAWGAFAVIVVINVYVQACWYCWWQGTGVTHGMRGLVPVAVPAMAALARCVQLSTSPVFRHAAVLLTTACGLWSWLMLPTGPTDYVSFAALADGLRTELDKMLDPRFIFLAMPGAFLLCVAAVVFSSRPNDDRPAFVPGTAAAALLSLWVVYVWTQMMLGSDFFGWLNEKRNPFLADLPPARQMAITAALAIAAGLGAIVFARFSIDRERLARWVSTVVISASLGLFGIAAFRIETGPTRIPTLPPTDPGKLYYVAEVRASWDDYQTIPGFDEPKRRLRDFMIREGIPLDVTSVPLPESKPEQGPAEGPETRLEN